jgi:hypothetical protein
MSLWEKKLGISKKETQIIKGPGHDLALALPDDLMVVKNKDQLDSLEDKQGYSSNKDSP